MLRTLPPMHITAHMLANSARKRPTGVTVRKTGLFVATGAGCGYWSVPRGETPPRDADIKAPACCAHTSTEPPASRREAVLRRASHAWRRGGLGTGQVPKSLPAGLT